MRVCIVYRYFRKHYLKRLADTFRVYMFVTCKTIFAYQLQEHSTKYADLINEKDLEQVTAVKEFGIKYLGSYDKHFEGLQESKTPKQFAKILGLQTQPAKY